MKRPARPSEWKARDPDFDAATRRAFAMQRAMALIGATLDAVEPGFVEIRVPFREDLTQQHGILHGGIVGMALDSACAFAIATLLPPRGTGLSLEYKVNFLAPARGEALLCRGWVTRIGRTVAVSSGDAYALRQRQEDLVATATETALHFVEGG